jgi:hypothetical protein
MAAYLGLDPVQEPLLMWIARQAVVAPLPQGWSEKEDSSGVPYYEDSVTGDTQRHHPLDPVFKMLLTVERARLDKGEFSFTRAGGLGSADSRRAVMRLQEESQPASGRAPQAYWYDWVGRKRVEDPSLGARVGGGRREGGQPYLPEDPTLLPSPLAAAALGDTGHNPGDPTESFSVSMMAGAGAGDRPPSPILSTSPGVGGGGGGGAGEREWDRPGSTTPRGGETPGTPSGAPRASSRLPVTLRTLAASGGKAAHSPSAFRTARDEMGGTVGGLKRGGTALR